jgi:hypothetical protein
MCHECDDDGQEEFNINMLPEDEREEFVEFASKQFHTVIEKASKHDILFELITEWPQAKQVMFTFATVMENKMLNNE